MSTHLDTDQTPVQGTEQDARLAPITPRTGKVRYEGSLVEFRGQVGRVDGQYPFGRGIRYDLVLDPIGDRPGVRLSLVRRESMAIVETHDG